MAMFETVVKSGLSFLLQTEAVEKLTTEQKLEEILQSVVLNYDQRDNHVSDKAVNFYFHIGTFYLIIISTGQ